MGAIHQRIHSLCSYLDELFEELYSLAELSTEADLGDHPQLNLVEPPQEQVQVGSGPSEALAAKRVVEQLVLGKRKRRRHGEDGEFRRTPADSLLVRCCFSCVSVRV